MKEISHNSSRLRLNLHLQFQQWLLLNASLAFLTESNPARWLSPALSVPAARSKFPAIKYDKCSNHSILASRSFKPAAGGLLQSPGHRVPLFLQGTPRDQFPFLLFTPFMQEERVIFSSEPWCSMIFWFLDTQINATLCASNTYKFSNYCSL